MRKSLDHTAHIIESRSKSFRYTHLGYISVDTGLRRSSYSGP